MRCYSHGMTNRGLWLGLWFISYKILRFTEDLDEWKQCQHCHVAFTSWFGKRPVNSNLHTIFWYQRNTITWIPYRIIIYCQSIVYFTIVAPFLPFQPDRRVFWQPVKRIQGSVNFTTIVCSTDSPSETEPCYGYIRYIYRYSSAILVKILTQ